MPNKIKKEYRNDYVHSPYQLNIFDNIQNGSGNLVIEASAGSGKSYTIVKSLELIPSDKSVLLTAFNKDIVLELGRKVTQYGNVTAMTMHSIGKSIIKRGLGFDPQLKEMKYIEHIKDNLKNYSPLYKNLPSKNRNKYYENVRKYVDFGRYYLCENVDDLGFVESRYGIDTIGDEKEVSLKILEWGKEHPENIEFIDMIWLPNVLDFSESTPKYDYIMIDECQDMNRAERSLVLKCRKKGTRVISVGDKNQCLYTFSGADPDSFDALCSIPNTKKLPLSISYRCGKNIIKLAQKIVPTIEEFDKNEDGEVVKGCSIEEVQNGDMVLCRNNAPLVLAYMEFLRMGKKAFIRGKDLGLRMKGYVQSMNTEELNFKTRKDGLENRMYRDFLKDMYDFMNKYGFNEKEAIMNSANLSSKLDMIMTIECLSEEVNTTAELIKKIDEIFKKDDGEGIALSTIHKAKGLEADRVYILCEELMPAKSAVMDWERTQEKNLIYVAYTRAKKKLGFLKEDKFSKLNPYNEVSIEYIKMKEQICSQLYGMNLTVEVTKDNAREIATIAKTYSRRDITSSPRSGNVKSLSDLTQTSTSTSMKSLFQNRRKRLK